MLLSSSLRRYTRWRGLLDFFHRHSSQPRSWPSSGQGSISSVSVKENIMVKLLNEQKTIQLRTLITNFALLLVHGSVVSQDHRGQINLSAFSDPFFSLVLLLSYPHPCHLLHSQHLKENRFKTGTMFSLIGFSSTCTCPAVAVLPR